MSYELSSTAEFRKSGDDRLVRLWNFLKRFDRVAPARGKPTARTCFCGTTAVLASFLGFALALFLEYLTSDPQVVVTNQLADAGSSAPLPKVAFSLCEYKPIEAITVQDFEKYVKPRFVFRRFIRPRGSEFQEERTMDLQVDTGDDCGLEKSGCTIFCMNLGVPKYSVRMERTVADDIGKTKTTYNESVEDNLTLSGVFGAEYYSFLDVQLDLQSADLSNMTEEFWMDSNQLKRRQAITMYLKFKSENWTQSFKDWEDGAWVKAFYNELPDNSSAVSPNGLHYEVDLEANVAHVGPRRPMMGGGFLEGGLLEGTTETVRWLRWESVFARPGGTHVQPYLKSSGKWNMTLLKANMRIGRGARDVTVKYETLVDWVIQLGAAYELALGFGVTYALILWAICRADFKAAFLAALSCWGEQFASADDAAAPSEEPEDSEAGNTEPEEAASTAPRAKPAAALAPPEPESPPRRRGAGDAEPGGAKPEELAADIDSSGAGPAAGLARLGLSPGESVVASPRLLIRL